MSLESNSLELLRGLFRKNGLEQAPVLPALGIANQSALSSFMGGYGLDAFSSANGVNNQTDYTRLESELISRYVDYEDQEESPLVSSCLDIYADDATQEDSMRRKTLWVESQDEHIRRELDDELLHRRLKIEERVWGEMRYFCKYGNLFGENVVKDGVGVLAVNNMPAPTVRRIEMPPEIANHGMSGEDNHGGILGFVYDPRGSFRISTREFIERVRSRQTGLAPTTFDSTSMVLEGWEVTHWRLMGRNLSGFYGYGIGEPARWIYKRLAMMEDSLILYRLTRSPSRYAFYVDVSNIPPNETQSYLNRVKQSLKKKKFVNPATGKIDARYDVSSNDEDFFMPVRDGKEATRVDTLTGPVYDQIEDVKFFENKLFAALKVPKPFLTYEESTAKTNLSAEDSRFARTVLRIQREYKNGYKKICNVHLAAKGIHPSSAKFDLAMTIPSAIFELAQMEIKNAQLELANNFGAFAPKEWVMTHILKLTDDQINEMERMRLSSEQQAGGNVPSSSGAISKALSGRGDRKSPPANASPSPTPAAPSGESTQYRYGSDQYLTSGKRKNTDAIMEKIDDLRSRNKNFERRWGRIEGLLSEIRSAIPRK